MVARFHNQIAHAVVGDIVERDVDGEDARQSGRYTMKEFGLYNGCLRTLESWQAAERKKALHVEFFGEVKVKEAGDRPCWKLKRTEFQKPEADGITELTIYVDKETWLQVGSILIGEEGKVIAEYYFRDIKLNPEFKPDQFKRTSLVPKE